MFKWHVDIITTKPQMVRSQAMLTIAITPNLASILSGFAVIVHSKLSDPVLTLVGVCQGFGQALSRVQTPFFQGLFLVEQIRR